MYIPPVVQKESLLCSEGTVVYDPKSGSRRDPWWLILKCDDDLAALYRWFFLKQVGIKLYPPAWGSHISINRGVEPFIKDFWGLDNGKLIKFHYDPLNFQTNGKHWWINCFSDEILDLRTRIGLVPDNHHKFKTFHLTIGKEKE